MTVQELAEILSKNPEELIKDLQVPNSNVPKWSELEPQYDPKQHKIFSTTLYPPKLDENGNPDFKRTSFALQKLAVSKLAQGTFATPVERVFSFDRQSESQKSAISLFEEIYRTENNIDAENIERSKMKYASCQVATVWRVYEEQNIIKGLPSKFKLTHKSYSEIQGYKIYPVVDGNDNLIVISFEYKDSNNVEHFEVYTNGLAKEYRKYTKGEDGFVLNTEVSKALEIFPVIYGWMPEPVWGGETGTQKVEQIEEEFSFWGLYNKKNGAPIFHQDLGDVKGLEKLITSEKSDDSRRIIKGGKGSKFTPVVWDGAGKSRSERIEGLKDAFFEENQIANNSFQRMVSSNTSAENKELIYADPKAKVTDLGGEWQIFLYKEFKIVVEFLKIMYPSIKTDLELITARTVIKPYSVKSRKENGDYVATSGGSMSLATQVKILDEVEDVDQEVAEIEAERSSDNNQFG